jgi:mannose-6-phosphate isomerase-like protein (cupin superfamily)
LKRIRRAPRVQVTRRVWLFSAFVARQEYRRCAQGARNRTVRLFLVVTMQPAGATCAASSATLRPLAHVSPVTTSCAGDRDSVKPDWHCRAAAKSAPAPSATTAATAASIGAIHLMRATLRARVPRPPSRMGSLDRRAVRGEAHAMRVLDIAELPVSDSGFTHELQGDAEGGGIPASLLFLAMPPGRGPDWHQHAYAELLVVLEGEATVDVGAERAVVRGGQVAIAPANVPHRFANTGDTTLRQIDIHLNEHTVTQWLEARAAAAPPAARP